MDKYQTFYQPNPEILELVQRIEQQLTQWSVLVASLSSQQRLVLQHRALHASLALDHNSLSLVKTYQVHVET